jgi:hypothetical protein
MGNIFPSIAQNSTQILRKQLFIASEGSIIGTKPATSIVYTNKAAQRQGEHMNTCGKTVLIISVMALAAGMLFANGTGSCSSFPKDHCIQ